MQKATNRPSTSGRDPNEPSEFDSRKAKTLDPYTAGGSSDYQIDGQLALNDKFHKVYKRLHDVEELCSMLRNDFFNSVTDLDRACAARGDAVKRYLLEMVKNNQRNAGQNAS